MEMIRTGIVGFLQGFLVSNDGRHFAKVVASIMNLNKFSHEKSEYSHVVHMFRNHITEEHFISKFVLSVSNSHERLGEAMPKYGTDLTSMPNMETCFKAVLASPKLYSIAHKLMWNSPVLAPLTFQLTMMTKI